MKSTPGVQHAAAFRRTSTMIQRFSILPLKFIGQIATSRFTVSSINVLLITTITASCRNRLLQMKMHMMMSLTLMLGHLVVIIVVVMRKGIPTKRCLVLRMKGPVQKLFIPLLLQPCQSPLSVQLLLRPWSLQVLQVLSWNPSGGWKKVVPINQVGFGTGFLLDI